MLGRVNDQLKIRGVRVEPAEVEAALVGHRSVQRAAVAVRDGVRGEPRLAAYYVANAEIEPAELRRWLEGRLPEAMIPSWIIPMKSLPLTPNGKVNRARAAGTGRGGIDLVELHTPRRGRTSRSISPRSRRSCWARRRVGIHDNFFDLGLDSIVGVRMVARARQAGLAVDPSQLFRTPTIAGLASSDDVPDVVDPTIAAEPFSMMPEGLDREALALRVAADGGIEDAYPLTPVQAGMLFHVLADPEAGHYVEQFSCDLRGETRPAGPARGVAPLDRAA